MLVSHLIRKTAVASEPFFLTLCIILPQKVLRSISQTNIHFVNIKYLSYQYCISEYNAHLFLFLGLHMILCYATTEKKMGTEEFYN